MAESRGDVTVASESSAFASRQDREADRSRKRLAVLREAAAQFCAKGYTATQMSEVARRLGVTKPVIYYYFRSKEDVLVACFELGYDLLQEALAAVPAGTGRDRLTEALRRYAELISTDFGRCTVRIHLADIGEDARGRIRASRRRFDGQIRALVEAAVADGSIPPCDPKIAAFTILGSLHWIGHWHQDGGELTREEAASRVVDQAMRGLDGHGASPREPEPAR